MKKNKLTGPGQHQVSQLKDTGWKKAGPKTPKLLFIGSNSTAPGEMDEVKWRTQYLLHMSYVLARFPGAKVVCGSHPSTFEAMAQLAVAAKAAKGTFQCFLLEPFYREFKIHPAIADCKNSGAFHFGLVPGEFIPDTYEVTNDSITRLRTEMIVNYGATAAFALGGRLMGLEAVQGDEGIAQEFELFQEYWPDAPLIGSSAGGGYTQAFGELTGATIFESFKDIPAKQLAHVAASAFAQFDAPASLLDDKADYWGEANLANHPLVPVLCRLLKSTAEGFGEGLGNSLTGGSGLLGGAAQFLRELIGGARLASVA